MNITIPPAALEAGARAAMLAILYEIEPGARASELTEGEHAEIARAAFLAMIEAWPGMIEAKNGSSMSLRPQIILPLPEQGAAAPQENSDE